MVKDLFPGTLGEAGSGHIQRKAAAVPGRVQHQNLPAALGIIGIIPGEIRRGGAAVAGEAPSALHELLQG